MFYFSLVFETWAYALVRYAFVLGFVVGFNANQSACIPRKFASKKQSRESLQLAFDVTSTSWH